MRSWVMNLLEGIYFLLETIEGDIKLLFVISSGLPTIKDHEHVTDLEMLSLRCSRRINPYFTCL
ncbi:hypothetical protein ZWY2020_040591 [Hordeum vulgare]|nr:hypothetical protein ZWY2020_040591 [Hordeum vulgare]